MKSHRALLLLILISIEISLFSKPYPIQFSISESKIVSKIPEKTQDFAFIVPGKLNTYIYNTEEAYYKDYQRSYFAITCKKAGWDCMRHYEILANGCIPYFVDLDQCNPDTMAFLPKELILEAMHLEGVSYMKIDHTKFNSAKYFELLEKILDHTRKYLTSKNMAQYVLKTVNYSGKGKILFLSYNTSPDYLRCTLLIGFKELLQKQVVDYPKINHVYKSYLGNIQHLYGRGISYTKILEDLPICRNNIQYRIRNREFDLIIYGSVHRGLLYHDLVKAFYSPEKIIYICGEDDHHCEYSQLQNLFLREYAAWQRQ